ncbi:MAG: Endo-1,4-beta-xylanase C precursor [candidate division BRC1 bacterium ADurb.BinA364]|nr:MAG: Endo-1,4-beta-xylanase C precursor [candidate division BRC1 bacterium ADurb.BinA364]
MAGPATMTVVSTGIAAVTGAVPMPADYTWTVHLASFPTATATQTFTRPTLDGVIGVDEWQGAPLDITYDIDPGTVSGPADLSAKMYVNYDAKWLYLGFDITDDVLANNPVSGSLWLNDSIEIFFDSDLSRTPDNAAPGGQYRINWDGQPSGNSDNLTTFGPNSTNEWYGVAATKAGGWIAELRFSLERIGEPVAPVLITSTIGFNVQVNDNDNNTTIRDTRLWWYTPIALTEVSARSDRWGYLNFAPWTNPPAAAGNWQIFE